jgi:hypothetical protein
MLSDQDLVSLFRKRFRVSWADDWFGELRRRSQQDRRLAQRLASLPPPTFPRDWSPQKGSRTRRAPAKDQMLKDLGHRPSLHAGS